MLTDWTPALVTTGGLGAALWLSRNLIATRLQRSVQHEFDAKLETLRSQFREGEERLRADIRAREAEIATLRSGALSALASRQVAIDQRRLLAVDQLWSTVTELSRGKAALMVMGVLKYEEAVERTKKDPRLREMFGAVGGSLDIKTLDLSGATKARPFLTSVVWATYSALLAMILHASMRLASLKAGMGKELLDDSMIGGLIKAALPHQANLIDKYGSSAFYLLVDELETKLLRDLQQMLAGVEDDKASVERAAEIVKRSNEVFRAVASKQTGADGQPV